MRVVVVPSVADGTHTLVSIIPEIPSKRAHSKRFRNFSKTYPGASPVRSIRFQIGNLENFGRMESAPGRSYAKISNTWRDHRLRS